MFTTSRARPLWVLACAGLAGCSSAPNPSAANRTLGPVAAPVASCARAVDGANHLRPASRQGAGIALGRAEGALVAYVANARARRIDVVDLVSKKPIGTITLEGTPEQVLLLGDGRLAVTLTDRAAIETIHLGADSLRRDGDPSCVVPVGRGPAGLATSDDATKVVVTSTLSNELTVLDAEAFDHAREVVIARAPKGVVVEGRRAYVSHVVGSDLTVVDLDGVVGTHAIPLGLQAATQQAPVETLSGTRRASQGYALASVSLPERAPTSEQAPVRGRAPRRRIVVPHVSVDVGDQSRFGVYYGPPPSTGIPKEAPVTASIDVESERPMTSHVIAMAPEGFARECLLPRAAASRDSSARLYVACRGIDELLELDGEAADPMRRVLGRVAISKGVSGLAIADAEGLGVAFGEFDETLDVISLADGKRQTIDLSVAEPKLSQSYRTGRELFYRTNDPRIAFDGLACASCHPDGGDDGLTWSTPDGPRQTPMLAGRVHGTAPYGWTRGLGTLPAYMENTIGRLGGSGLDAGELNALASYLERMTPPGAPPAEGPDPNVDRGRVVFQESGCNECHRDVVGTDHQAHKVLEADDAYDTPTLKFVGLTAPYFHDGRYRTLDALLLDPNSKMGATASISTPDRKALARFLETL